MQLALERAFQSALGGGCHTAFGVHATADTLYFFHEKTGLRSLPLTPDDLAGPTATAVRVLKLLGLP
jgi:hydroxymethylbilane synthase